MKKYLKDIKTWLIGSGIAIIGIGITVLVYFIERMNDSVDVFPYPFVIVGLSAIFFLSGIISGDIYFVVNKNKDNQTEEDVISNSYKIKTPLYVAALILLIIVAVLLVFYLFARHWPFLG